MRNITTLFELAFMLSIQKTMFGSPVSIAQKPGWTTAFLTAINKDEFSKIVLPIISPKKQTPIQQKVIESFNLRKQSKRLLGCAKRAVEMAIEQDEKTAINWLENETKEMQI